jgi:putative DNA primase/helicase
VKLTDAGIADAAAKQHSGRLRYCEARKKWLSWNGRHWSVEDGEAVALQTVFELSRQLQHQALTIEDHDRRKRFLNQAMAYEGAQKAGGALSALKTVPVMRTSVAALDADPHLLNCANGIVDLRRGTLTAHDPDRMMTRCTGVEYISDARSDLWERFVDNLTNGDSELRDYVQRAVGMSLWGYPVEKAFFFLWGVPDSGKSRFLDALQAALGSYVAIAAFTTWLQQTHTGGNRGDLVTLAGARIVVSSEVREQAKLDAELVKSVTGGDTLKAAAKYENEVEIRPSFTLWWAANHRPRVRADDSGFFGRARVIGCKTPVPKQQQDPTLAARWREPEHAKAILAWLIDGCLKWQRDGLGTCASVDGEVRAYRDSQDPTTEFWTDRVEAGGPSDFVPRTALWNAWAAWTSENGGDGAQWVKQRELYQKALERFPHAEEHKRHGTRGFCGLRLTMGDADVRPPFAAGVTVN